MKKYILNNLNKARMVNQQKSGLLHWTQEQRLVTCIVFFSVVEEIAMVKLICK